MSKHQYIVGTIFALILLISADFISRDNLFGDFSIKYQLRKRELKNEIRHVTKEYQKKNEILLQRFEQELGSAGAEDFHLARARVNYVAKELSSYKNCAILCGKFVADNIKKTHGTSQFIQSIIGPNILIPCQNGSAKLISHLETFQHKLQENNNQYNAALAQITKEKGKDLISSKAHNDFVKNNEKLHTKTRELAVSKILTAAGGALELVFIKGTVKMLARVFAHVTGKLAASGSTAAVSAVADGPFPIGDIIGAVIGTVGIIWTAYDLYEVHVTLPNQMRNSLHEMIRKYEMDCRQEVLQMAKASVEQFHRDSEDKKNLL